MGSIIISSLQTTVQIGLLTHVNVNEHLQFIVTRLHCYRDLNGTVRLGHFTVISVTWGVPWYRAGERAGVAWRARCSGAASDAGDARAAAVARDCASSIPSHASPITLN